MFGNFLVEGLFLLVGVDVCRCLVFFARMHGGGLSGSGGGGLLVRVLFSER